MLYFSNLTVMQVLTVDLRDSNYVHRFYCIKWYKYLNSELTLCLLDNSIITIRDIITSYVIVKDIVDGCIQEALVNSFVYIPLDYKDAITKRLHSKYKKYVTYGGYYPNNVSPTHIKIIISE